MAQLRTAQGHVLSLPEGRVSLGAGPGNDVPIAAPFGLAAVHFHLQAWEGGHFIEDAGSGLGTRVNGVPVHWHPLADGDLITAGTLEVVYHAGTVTDPAATALPFLETPLSAAPAGSLSPAAGPARFASVSLPMPAPFQYPAFTSPAWPGTGVTPPVPESAPPPAWLPEELLPGAAGGRDTAEFSSATQSAPPQAGATYPFRRRSAGALFRMTGSGKRRAAAAAALVLLTGCGGLLLWRQATDSSHQTGSPGIIAGKHTPPPSPIPQNGPARHTGAGGPPSSLTPVTGPESTGSAGPHGPAVPAPD